MKAYEKYLAEAQALYAQPHRGVPLKEPKYSRGTRVHITDELGPLMTTFEGGVDAIVEHTAAYECWEEDGGNYALLLLDESGDPDYGCAWYEESQLTLVSDNTAAGQKLLQAFGSLTPDH